MSGPKLTTLITALVTFITLASAGHAGERTTTPLTFSTERQPLFGAIGGSSELIDLDLVFFEEHIAPTTRGEIRRLPEEIPVETLQRIWQNAINTCLAQSYTVPVIGVTISPTQAECESGTISRRYCTFPPQLGWDLCPGFAQETFTRSLGAGIGPRPTQPATRDFDVGAIVTYRADVRMGVRGLVTLDQGSVDVAFAGNATIQTDVSEALPGDVVTITTDWVMNKPAADMVSRYPNIDFSLGSYVFTDANVKAEYAAPDVDTGQQIRATRVLYDEKSLASDLENVGADGVVEFADTEWFGLNVSPAGLEVRVLEEGATVVDGSTLFEKNILYPFLPKGVIRPPWQPGFSLAEAALISPKLDTPALNGFNCGDCLEPPLRNFVDVQNRIINTTPVGPRTLIGGLIGENGPELPFIDNGLQDGDFFRFDLDVDSISAVLGAPLGVNFEGPEVKFPKRLVLIGGASVGPVIGINLEAVDMDVAGFFSADQKLMFDPRVSVDLTFDKMVDVRLAGESDFTARNSVSVRLGQTAQFRQVAGGVRITPVFTARDNRFTNDTAMKLALVYQQTMGQIELYGLVPGLASGVFDLPTNFAVSQISPELVEPITFWTSQPDRDNLRSYPLSGFTDIAGSAFSVSESSSGGGGSGGGGGGSGSGSSGSGGGAFSLLDAVCFAALLLVVGRRRRTASSLRATRGAQP
jgi:hypothetical protein